MPRFTPGALSKAGLFRWVLLASAGLLATIGWRLFWFLTDDAYIAFRAAGLEKWRTPILALVLLGTVTNRTFLTWLSSGLETALFNLLLTWWVFEACTPPGERRFSWAVRLSSSAALMYLARPDGLLAVAATLVALLLEYWRSRQRLVKCLVSGLPLLAAPIHLIWRRHTYGLWLPNTYYAKYVSPWPESGLRYLASFVLEYGAWVWIAILLAWLSRVLLFYQTSFFARAR